MQAPRRRRWPWLLGVGAALSAVGAVWVNAQLEPNRLASTVLGKAGEALQLQLGFEGTPEYAFKPEPRLVLPGFRAASLDGREFLSARRAEISLPWSTITGGEPVITRVQLDAPVLDLPGLQRWLDSRPPTPFKLPTLVRGLSVSKGSVRADDWSLSGLSLALPHLQAGDPAKLEARAVWVSGTTSLPFTLDAMVATPGLASALDLKLVLTPRAEPALAAPGAKTAAAAPIAIALQGRYEWADPKFRLEATKFGLLASSPIPSLEGSGALELADQASLNIDAVLSRWPQTWPKLPAALAAQSEALPVQLRYAGARDFSDPLSLHVVRGETSLQASLRVPELRQWLAADATSPLPPLQATLKTPALDFDGIELQGVEVTISEGPEAAP